MAYSQWMGLGMPKAPFCVSSARLEFTKRLACGVTNESNHLIKAVQIA